MKKIKLNKGEVRVAIIKDALKRLRYRKIETGDYILINNDALYEELQCKNNGSKQVQKIIPKIEKNCQVCQLGNLFLSYIRIYDKIQYKNFNTHYPLILCKFFSQKQLVLIENAFERMENTVFSDDPKKRAKEILKNMLENEGMFCP